MVNESVKGGTIYMKKNMKKVLMFSVLGMFLTVFAMQFVAAANPIGDWFANWESADMSANIAKYLFWALVSMFVYSIGPKLPGLKSLFKNDAGEPLIWGWIFAIIVGFLSMAYITPDEVWVMMSSYSALGFVLSGMLPFIILLFFTLELATSTESASGTERYGKMIIAGAMWLFFIGFIAYKLFFYDTTVGPPTGVMNILYWVVFLLGFVVVMFIKPIFRTIWKGLGKAKKLVMKNVLNKSVARDKANAKAADDMAEQMP